MRTEGISPTGAFGRYQLLELIGRGALTEVHRAKSFGVEGFEKTLVIKVLRPDVARDEAVVGAFIAGAQQALRLRHGNIAQLFDLGRVTVADGERYFVATELVRGATLEQLIAHANRTGRMLPVGLVLYVLTEAVRALDYAHRYRDEELVAMPTPHAAFNPSNVLLSWDGEVKVSGFCLGQAAFHVPPEQREERELRLTLGYGAPELITHGRIDWRGDLFSVGVVLHEALTGLHPFGPPTIQLESLRTNVLTMTPRRLLGLRPEAPAGLETLLGVLLAPIDQRIESAAALHEQLLALAYESGPRFDGADLAEHLEAELQGRPVLSALPRELDLELSHPGFSLGEVTLSTFSSIPPPPVAGEGMAVELRDVTGLVLLPETPLAAGDRMTLRDTIQRHGGQLHRDAAEEVVALFGLEGGEHRDAEVALRAATAVLRGLADGDAPRVGLASASVAVTESAQAIADERLDGLLSSARAVTAFADTGLLVARSTARLLRRQYRMLPVDQDDGGKGRAFLVGEARSPQEIFGRFVGRKEELRTIGARLSDASHGQRQVVGVFGDAGIGKSRLCRELLGRIRRGGFPVSTVEVTCLPSGSQTPLSGLATLYRGLCGVRDGDSRQRLQSVEPRLRALGLGAEELYTVLELLAGASTATLDDAHVEAALRRTLASLASEATQLFIVDDAHELDPSSLTVLGRVLGALPSIPVLVVLAGREAPSAAAQLPALARLHLGPLDDDDTYRLIAARLGVDDVPPTLVEFLRERAGGHPMFTEELLREAIASGSVVLRQGRVESLRLDGALTVPRPLRTLLADRLRSLEPALRATLRALAVLGERGAVPLLAAMLDESVPQVLSDLERGGRAGVLEATPAGHRFASPLLGEVLLGLSDDRALEDLHRRAAAAYDAVFGDEALQHAEAVGGHLAAAGDDDEAASYFAHAGFEAFREQRMDRAARLLGRAVELADLERRGTDEVASWLPALAASLRHAPGAIPDVGMIRRLATYVDGLGDAREQLELSIHLVGMLGSVHRFRQARTLADLLAKRTRAWPELARRVSLVLGELLVAQGAFRAALEQASAVETVDDLPPAEAQRYLLVLASARSGVGDHAGADAALGAAAALDGAEPGAPASIALTRAQVLLRVGDSAGAVEQAATAERLAREAGVASLQAWALHLEGMGWLRQGAYPKAYAAVRRSLEIAVVRSERRLVNLDHMVLAYLSALGGDAAAVRELGARIVRAEERRWTTDEALGRLLLGRYLLPRDGAGARHELGQAETIAAGCGDEALATLCRDALARA